ALKKRAGRIRRVGRCVLAGVVMAGVVMAGVVMAGVSWAARRARWRTCAGSWETERVTPERVSEPGRARAAGLGRGSRLRKVEGPAIRVELDEREAGRLRCGSGTQGGFR